MKTISIQHENYKLHIGTLFLCVYVCDCVHVCACVCVFVCMYICMYVYVYVCVCISCMHVQTYMWVCACVQISWYFYIVHTYTCTLFVNSFKCLYGPGIHAIITKHSDSVALFFTDAYCNLVHSRVHKVNP